jgi:hypothetical protein
VHRVTLITALALQLFACLAPANAFVICISNDGCVELERSVPGASRCTEDDCDKAHAGDTSHRCRDIPILLDSGGPSRATIAHHLDVAMTTATAAPRIALAPVVGVFHVLAAPHHRIAPPRTVVLQL